MHTHSLTNALVTDVYSRLATIYDVLFGYLLQPGRVAAVSRIPAKENLKLLEIGVGTGLNVPLYPDQLQVTGIDISEDMLQKARARVAGWSRDRILLMQMDAAHLTFADASFDVVYAPYTISVVPDPVAVVREMHRVCKVGGTLIFLNHFRSQLPMLARLEEALSSVTINIGFRCDLDFESIVTAAHITAISSELVNLPPIWRLVTCIKN